MWTNRLISTTDTQIQVEFKSNGNRFIKLYNTIPDDVEEFLASKLAEIETLTSTYQTLQQYVNVEQSICDGWTFKFTYISMPADWIELFVDVTYPNRTLTKMYSTQAGRSIEFVSGFLSAEKAKLADMITNSDVEGLSNYFGQEVTVNGS
jgi:hypothetical protein